MTTVAFVTYKVPGGDRRVGPLPTDTGITFAKSLTRNNRVSDVVLEEWALVKTTPFHEEKLA